MDPAAASGPFVVTFVSGVVPDKWARAWRERSRSPLVMTPVERAEQLTALRAGQASMALVRLPVDGTGLHLIPLYRERPVVVVSREHPVAAYDEIDVTELADEHLLQDPDEVPAWRDLATEVRGGTRYPVPPMTDRQAVESVAAEAGIVILPMSVARLHHRKDVVAVPVTGVDETQVGLTWPVESDDPRIEEFVGVVRGRTARSSRGPAGTSTPAQPSARGAAKPAGKRTDGTRTARPPRRSPKPGKGRRSR